MNAGGKKEVLYEGVNVGEKDYSAIISKLKASGAEYLMWGGLHTEGGLIVRQMRDQGMTTVMISGDGITDNEFASIGGPGVVGTYMSFGPDPRNNPAGKDVVAEVRAKGFEPEGYTLYSYAAVQIMKQAAEKVGALDPHKMADYIHTGAVFHTVLGDITYDKKGDRTTADYVWYTWVKDRGRQGHLSSAVIDASVGSLARFPSPPRPGGLFSFPGPRRSAVSRAARSTGKSRSAKPRRSASRR